MTDSKESPYIWGTPVHENNETKWGCKDQWCINYDRVWYKKQRDFFLITGNTTLPVNGTTVEGQKERECVWVFVCVCMFKIDYYFCSFPFVLIDPSSLSSRSSSIWSFDEIEVMKGQCTQALNKKVRLNCLNLIERHRTMTYSGLIIWLI